MFPYWDLASIISPPCKASDFARTRGGLGQVTQHTGGSFPTRLGPAFAQLMHSNHPLRRLHSLQTSQYIRYVRDPKGILEKFDSKWNVTNDRKQICSEMYAIAKITILVHYYLLCLRLRSFLDISGQFCRTEKEQVQQGHKQTSVRQIWQASSEKTPEVFTCLLNLREKVFSLIWNSNETSGLRTISRKAASLAMGIVV